MQPAATVAWRGSCQALSRRAITVTKRWLPVHGGARSRRQQTAIATRGLYLDMPAWGAHVFEVREAVAAP